MWDGDRISAAVDEHIDRHPRLWVLFTLAVIVAVILLLMRAVGT